MEVMNSKSPNDFRWSIRLTGDTSIGIGIASQLQRKENFVVNYDEYAILYYRCTGIIYHKSKNIEIDIECGGEIHFRFQPKQKKFSFAIVCIILFMVNRL